MIQMLFLLVLPAPPTSTLFPYTTLFRSRARDLELEHLCAIRLDALSVGRDRRRGRPGLLPAAGAGDRSALEHRRGLLERFSEDRKSTRLNSSHRCISYAVFCLKKKRQR